MPCGLPLDCPVRAPLAVFALALAAGFAAWYLVAPRTPPRPQADEVDVPDPPPPDPRLTFPTAFRNVKPEVKYLGDTSCAGCHLRIDTTYHAHPMGRSAAFVG